MRVTLCVDALEPRPGGIGRYTWQLCQGLARAPDIEAQFFARNQLIRDPSRLLQGNDHFRRRPRGFRKLGAWWDKRLLNGSLVHGPNYFLPPVANDGVITVHDLSVFKYPETHPNERVRAFHQQFQRSLDRALHIITDTETVRAELIEDFGLAPESITAVALGVERRFGQLDRGTDELVLSRLGLRPNGYALCISTLEPRKKIGELLTAWRRLSPALLREFPLVLAGGSGWLNDHLRADIERGVAEGWLRHLGFVDDTDLPTLYSGATLFAYPSIYEGFGLPPLEAMASGAPVVVSASSCLPEVCGDAARYINPDDPDGLVSSLTDCLSDETWRAEASERGRVRASSFTWDRCVRETVDVYRKVMKPV